jgi:hypothetical protein
MIVKLGCHSKGEQRWSVFKFKVLRRTSGPNTEKIKENGENSIMRSFVSCTLHQILLGRLNEKPESHVTLTVR